jgi:drug/metabolite transporter (DMT)-like permease
VGWRSVAATPEFVMSVLAGLLAALLYAIAAPYIKHHLADVPPLVTVTGSQLGAALLLIPAVPFTVPQQLPSLEVALAVLGLTLLSTVLAYILYFRLIQSIGSTRALTVTYLIPMFAMLWGAMVLQEAITASMVVGCGLVLLGTAIANNLFAKTVC